MIRIAAIQCRLGDSLAENHARVAKYVHEAANQGAKIILPPELFSGPYFPQEEREEFFDWAFPVEEHPAVIEFAALAKELDVVIPISFYERDGQEYYNSVVVIDGENTLGTYRKSHIPDGPGYEEKFYFKPGDSGFKVWQTRFGKIGVGICWDQWFPEAARAMTLMDAEVLLYPTAIGSEPEEPDNDTKDPWQRVMIGHAVANAIPVIAANRIGQEADINFYGSSFIADQRGDFLAEMGREDEGVILSDFDPNELRRYRAMFGFFRDRRPTLYRNLVK